MSNPEILHTLPAESFQSGPSEPGEECGCLLSHMRDAFSPGSHWNGGVYARNGEFHISPTYRGALKVMVGVVRREPVESEFMAVKVVWKWNDKHGRTNEERAQMWGKFVAAMGYTEDA